MSNDRLDIEKEHIFSDKEIWELHLVYSRLIWFENNCPYTPDYLRMIGDWRDARRIVGFKLADELIKGCKSRVCFSLPSSYFPYLSSLSVQEFKRMKAYFIWYLVNEKKKLSESDSREIYLNACDEVEQSKVNCKCDTDESIPENIIKFLRESREDSYHNIIKRKAYWNGLHENNSDEAYNWNKAEQYVYLIYKPLESSEDLTHDDVIRIIEVIDDNHSIANMFEYCIRCYLFKHQSLTRPNSENRRKMDVCCAKTGTPIKSKI